MIRSVLKIRKSHPPTTSSSFLHQVWRSFIINDYDIYFAQEHTTMTNERFNSNGNNNNNNNKKSRSNSITNTSTTKTVKI